MANGVDNKKEPTFVIKTCIFHSIHLGYILFDIHTRFIWGNCGMDGDLNAHNSMQEAALKSVELAVERTATKFQYIYNLK